MRICRFCDSKVTQKRVGDELYDYCENCDRIVEGNTYESKGAIIEGEEMYCGKCGRKCESFKDHLSNEYMWCPKCSYVYDLDGRFINIAI